jgi:hypothetical protein
VIVLDALNPWQYAVLRCGFSTYMHALETYLAHARYY